MLTGGILVLLNIVCIIAITSDSLIIDLANWSIGLHAGTRIVEYIYQIQKIRSFYV